MEEVVVWFSSSVNGSALCWIVSSWNGAGKNLNQWLDDSDNRNQVWFRFNIPSIWSWSWFLHQSQLAYSLGSVSWRIEKLQGFHFPCHFSLLTRNIMQKIVTKRISSVEEQNNVISHNKTSYFKGDSGGPLIVRDQLGQYVQVGITSFGASGLEGLVDQKTYPGITIKLTWRNSSTRVSVARFLSSVLASQRLQNRPISIQLQINHKHTEDKNQQQTIKCTITLTLDLLGND